MAKIIKDNSAEKKVCIHTCPKCLSVIEFEKNEVITEISKAGRTSIAICPVCSHRILANFFTWGLSKHNITFPQVPVEELENSI